MYSTLKVGEKVFIIRKSSEDEPIKTFVKEVILKPTEHSGMLHSGMYDIHGFGEMFGEQLRKIREEEEPITA